MPGSSVGCRVEPGSVLEACESLASPMSEHSESVEKAQPKGHEDDEQRVGDARLADDEAEAQEDDDAEDGARARHEDAEEGAKALLPLPAGALAPASCSSIGGVALRVALLQQQHFAEAVAAGRANSLLQEGARDRQRAAALPAEPPELGESG